MRRSTRWRKRFRDGSLAILGVSAIGAALFLALYAPAERPIRLRMTAGQEAGTRHRIARELRREAARRGLFLDLRPTAGSQEALRAVDSGEIDAALVQGGIEMDDPPNLRQVATLHVEPLHLLVKREIHREVSAGLGALRDRVLALGEPGSGSRLLAAELLESYGLRAGADFRVSDLGYAELERQADRARLPDAVFTVSTLPSPIARRLVARQGYRLVPLPYLEAFALGALDREPAEARPAPGEAIRIDRRHVYEATIPAFLYETDPDGPAGPIPTLGTRLLIVARRDLPPAAVRRLLDVVFNSPFARFIHPPLDAKLLELRPELPWHDGAAEFIRRGTPLIAGDVIDLVEKEVSIVGVIAGGVLCLVQWVRRRTRWRRDRGFEAYILEVADVERRAVGLSRAPTLDLAALLALQEELIRLKDEALRRFAEGDLHGEELMSGFLAHISDARDFLVRLILHQRDNLEDQARAQHRRAEALWAEAIAAGDGQGSGIS